VGDGVMRDLHGLFLTTRRSFLGGWRVVWKKKAVVKSASKRHPRSNSYCESTLIGINHPSIAIFFHFRAYQVEFSSSWFGFRP
jgi:hypothetical protein